MMPIRSVAKKTATYVASAALLSLLIIVASTLYLGLPAAISPSAGPTISPGQTGSISSTSLAGPQSLLVVQLTDPPQVPFGTRSLNLTYSSLSLVVGEPGAAGKVNPTSVGVTPTAGSSTLNLLKLQNVSQTIASTNLPNGSVIYSVAFAVSAIAINVNGTVSSVSLATGGNSFSVTIAQPSPLAGENVALLQLNPIVVGTPTGYQLIPSSVGVIKHSQGEGEEQVGSQHQLNQGDNGDLKNAHGNLTATLSALSLSGNTTVITVQVRNTGNAAVELNAIGLHGNFTAIANQCSPDMMFGSPGHRSHAQGKNGQDDNHHMCELPQHMNEVVFVPVSPTTSATSKSSSTTTTTNTAATICSAGQMKLVNGVGGDQGANRGFTLQAGQCVNFTFTGIITFGGSANVILPSTAAGQTYDVNVIASNGANLDLACTLPLGAGSCKVVPFWGFAGHISFPFG